MSALKWLCVFLIAVYGLCSALQAQQGTPSASLPVTHTKTLSGKAITVPVSDHAQTFLVVGFSHASAASVKAWWLQAADLCKSHPAVACYEAAVIQEAPSFVRGMITSGMKHDMPAEVQETFLTVVENEPALKQVFGFSAPDDAYLGIFDKSGKLLWRTSGGEKAANSADIAKGFDTIPR